MASEIRSRFSLVVISTVVALFMCEGLVRTVYPPPKKYFVHQPGLHRVFETHPEIMPGVQGRSHFIVNSRGVRGDELDSGFDYRILAWGGSTTECLYLDQEESWPYLIQKNLNERQKKFRVWVGNAGKTGVTTREHRYQIPILLKEFPHLDTILFLVGVNDVLLRLAREEGYDPYFADKPESVDFLLSRGFSVVPAASRTEWWKHSRILDVFAEVFEKQRLLAQVRQDSSLAEDVAGEVYQKRRSFRRHAMAIRDEAPDLSSGLEEYGRNLEAIIHTVNTARVRLVLITQPVLWDADLSEDLQNLLWTGGVYSISGEGIDYYSVRVLAHAMEAYNQKLKEIAGKFNLELVDLAADFPKDTTVFYDDCHFNENGARLVAEILTDYLLEHKPFKSGKAL